MRSCRIAAAIFAVPAVLFVACEEAPKPVTPTPTSAPPPIASAPAVISHEPVAILDLPARVKNDFCQQHVVMVVAGSAQANGESLAVHDALVTVVTGKVFEIGGTGTVVVASRGLACDEPTPPMKKVTRASDAPELTWADGAMHAHLDVGEKQGAQIYLGRLEGTAPVADHAHENSTEIVATIEGTGTFTVNGVPQKVKPRQIVQIPANTKHSWTPDPGTKLVAVQVYDPPGPEQRFLKLSGH